MVESDGRGRAYRHRKRRCSTIRRFAASPTRRCCARRSCSWRGSRSTTPPRTCARAKIATGFGFLGQHRRLRHHPDADRLFEHLDLRPRLLVGLLNTLLVAALGIVFATILGFVIGIARLSKNWLVARIAGVYVETIRNIPLLLQLLFWYNAVLKALPGTRESFAIPGGAFLNNRGLFLPQPVLQPGSGAALTALGVGVVAAIVYRAWAKRRQMRPASRRRCCGPRSASSSRCRWPSWRCRAFRSPSSSPRPALQLPRRHRGAAGIHRAAVRARDLYRGLHRRDRAGRHPRVARGQTEAAYSLGLRPGPTLRLVVIPQAMRVIIPPLTSQYLNLTKNSSLAVAIGYPDLVPIFAGTVAQPDRPGGRGHRHHHGGLSHHQPGHLGAHELVQPPHGAGGALSDIATTHRRQADGGPAFVRARPLAPLPPPIAEAGADRLAAQEPVFGCAQHHSDHRLRAADRLDRAAARQVPADRRGVGRFEPGRCLPSARASRGRRLLGLRHRPHQLLHLRLLPDRRALAGQRVLRAARRRRRLAGVARRAAARPRRGLLLRHLAGRFADPAARLAADRPAAGRDHARGAASW